MYLTLMTQTGGDALVSSGIMESLLQVLEWKAFEPMNITVSPKNPQQFRYHQLFKKLHVYV